MSIAKAKPRNSNTDALGRDSSSAKCADQTDLVDHAEGMATEHATSMQSLDDGFLTAAKLLATPLWVWSLEDRSLFWANPAALEFWGESDFEGLKRQSLSAPQLNGCELRAEHAKPFGSTAFQALWTANRSGEPQSAICRITPVRLSSNAAGLLAEVLPDIGGPADGPPVAASEAQTRDIIIENIPQGFALFDSDDRLITCNSQYLNIHPQIRDIAKPGATYKEIVTTILEHAANSDCGQTEKANDCVIQQIEAYLEQHNLPTHVSEQRLADGCWLLISEKRTSDGGTVVLHTNVTELKRREAALERSNHELQDFASVASHDLQEPLRKIEAFGDRLKAKCADTLSDEGKLYLERMQSAAGRMRILINDLLSYSRVTTKAQPFVPVELSKIVDEVVSDLQVAIEDSKAEIDVSELPTFEADPLQIQLLVQNLLSNALKFARPGVAPRVCISARMFHRGRRESDVGLPTGEVCEITVADNGIGFDMKHRERIFNIFQRLHGKDDYPGTGIGLATCRKITERHNGNITASSEQGQGSTFVVTLPVRQSNKEHES